MPSAAGGIAWWAHIGGFVAGVALTPLLRQPEQRYRAYYADEGILGFDPVGPMKGSCRKGGTMSVMDLFWLFFMISALQPLLQQRLLEAMRMRKIAQLERKRNSRVILLVHRQETMRLLGFPLVRYIDVNDSEQVLRAIQMTDQDVPLDIVLHTPGGLVLAASQIARAIGGHKAKVTVFVPHYAMSGGTLIALAADEIVMSRHAVLGPVDPQLGNYPAASLIKVVEQKPIAEIDDETLIMADVGRKAIEQVKKTARDLLERQLSPEQAEALAEKLSTGTWTHDYPILPGEAKEFGLNISTEMPDDVLRADVALPAARALTAGRCRVSAGAAAEAGGRDLAVGADRLPLWTTLAMRELAMQLREEMAAAQARWGALTFYQKFEQAVILILTGLIAIVIVVRVVESGAQGAVQPRSLGHLRSYGSWRCFRRCSA